MGFHVVHGVEDVNQTYAEPTSTNISILILYAYTAVYIALGIGLFVKRRESFRELVERTTSTARNAMGSSTGQAERAD